MSLVIEPFYQLDSFKKLVENFSGNQNIEWILQDQAISRNYDRPWIQLETTRSTIDSLDEYIEDVGDKVRFRVVLRHRLLINVHCKSRNNEQFQAFKEAINLQGLLLHSEVSKRLGNIGVKIVFPDEETETLPAIEFNSAVFDSRLESDIWFPLTLSMVSEINSAVLDTDWFEAILLTTDINGIDPSLNLDNERIPEE